MTDFNDREKAFEKKYEHDQEIKFKVASRAAKMLGLWAAEKIGLESAALNDYVAGVVEADLALPGHDDLIDKVEGDLKAKSIDITRKQIAGEFEACLEKARLQVMQE